MFSPVRYQYSCYLFNSRYSVRIHEMWVVLYWVSCPIAVSLFLPMTSSMVLVVLKKLIKWGHGCKSFELLWEKHTLEVMCELYIGSGRVDAWPKPILWWIVFLLRTYYVLSSDMWDTLSQSQFLRQLVMVLFWRERIWKVIYSTPYTGRLSESLEFPLYVWHISFFLPITFPPVFQPHAFCQECLIHSRWMQERIN